MFSNFRIRNFRIKLETFEFKTFKFETYEFETFEFEQLEFKSLEFKTFEFESIEFDSLEFETFKFKNTEFHFKNQVNYLGFNSVPPCMFYCFLFLFSVLISTFFQTCKIIFCHVLRIDIVSSRKLFGSYYYLSFQFFGDYLDNIIITGKNLLVL